MWFILGLVYRLSSKPSLQQAPDSKKPVEIISYWHPNLTINLMDDQTPWAEGSVPQPLDECEYLQLNSK